MRIRRRNEPKWNHGTCEQQQALPRGDFHNVTRFYSILKLNLLVLPGKRERERELGFPRRSRRKNARWVYCLHLCHTRSIIDSTRTHRATNRRKPPPPLPLPTVALPSPQPAAPSRRDRGPFGTLIKYLKYQYCFTLTLSSACHCIRTGSD